MKKLVIIGAGGMGRTMFNIATESLGYGTEFEIKGFIDDNLNALDGFEGYPHVLSKIADYVIEPDDVFTFSIGGDSRKACIESMVKKNAEFVNLIHKTARIGANVRMGVGNIVAAFVSIGPDCVLGDYNMIQSCTVIGHDAHIGSFNRLDTHVTCVGGITVEDEATIHTSAVINHKVKVGNKAKVGACSFVIRNVREGQTVFGVPAKKL